MKIVFAFILTFITAIATGQTSCDEMYSKKFTKAELDTDISFMREKILNAHINPFTEITKEEFEANIQQIRNTLKDGMTQKEFYFLVKPVIVKLNDEHSALGDFCIPDSIKKSTKIFPLRFRYMDNKVILTESISDENLVIGDELLSINNIPVAEIVNNCSQSVFGIADERKTIFVENLGNYISRFCYFIPDNYQMKFKSGKEAVIKRLGIEEVKKKMESIKKPATSNAVIAYEKINESGYLTVNSFGMGGNYTMERWRQMIDSIFTIIQKDSIRHLVIDVSNNGGGNSAIGNIFIDHFSDKSYRQYGGSWKRSDEYADFMKSIKMEYAPYQNTQNGELLALGGGLTKPSKTKNRFTGKTYVLVGGNTFSSAMMFAVMVLDNKLATVAGQTPSKGHPNHFGELIGFRTPNTQLEFRFGVKEWIRPSGVLTNNKLIPDIIFDFSGKSKEEIIRYLTTH